jgi:succinate dehydrogenase hydrophobic anchor subunit
VPKKQLARSAGKFVKHVLPAAVKPIHSLWHEILGFIFLVFAVGGVWGIIRHTSAQTPMRLFILIVFIVVMAVYSVSSFLKARNISRS